MKPVEEVIDDLQCRALAYEIIFQSICSQLPQVFIEKAAENIDLYFETFESSTHSEAGKVKLKSAKAIATRILGTRR
ncbi:hypothetical protein KXR87_18700 [Yokenella regensburgei]|uniref:hypothetical protein n=1 Tax=Yokenella regensburgei TaxID=158877 RepID=UPI003F18601B